MKFIHTADWQIGKQLVNIKGNITAFLHEVRLDVIKTLASLANQCKADAILVAGDVSDIPKSVISPSEIRLIQCWESKAYRYRSQEIMIPAYPHSRN
ncbi:hypothetical protein SCV69_07785 [Legionella pneumophila serogroup 1]|uniref:hypothetical protein n=1 Tax=Legionella pneumophila TaxID=446 RepID=UPI000770A155|nr:hypothetical protein [Legionella pneumophila]HAT8874843.1 hypothetical protein [Legionella pneumophila subsp. pneumophila]CZG51244.1 exonuclease SbcCD%2C D subunit [Legionella pneumophila]CZG65437.1 exonuclease SbcCD%2C D subunit [Legionella pneumophila]HAT8948507.1 hypothetical protein [Legionella pneumophila subsp. pneumophila]HAT9144236.1 hypothetical protein [Legionella pneumophila subsp. pneumophila]